MAVRRERKIFNSLIKRSLIEQGEIFFKARGGSMSPVIRDGSVLKIKSIKEGTVRRGDAVLYEAKGSLLIHRIESVKRGRVSVSGDSVDGVLHNIGKKDILGIVVEGKSRKIFAEFFRKARGVLMKKKSTKKEKYEKPAISSQRVFENSTLACGKCNVGPIKQAACTGFPKKS